MDEPNKHETGNNQPILSSQAILERPADREAAQTSAPKNNAASDAPNKPHNAAAEAKTTARAKAAENAREELPGKGEAPLMNVVESDEISRTRQGDSQLVPLDIEQQYVRVGNKFYHPKNAKLVAFEDKGNRLETKSNSENIVASMVRIAEARGWDEIKVSGSETFRREAWLEAATRGLRVKGYFPDEQDKAALAARSRNLATNTIQRNGSFRGRENNNKELATASERAQDAPFLVAHGAAKYLHDDKNTDSYYLTTRGQDGAEKTLWGVDLQRAITESGAKIGDQIRVENEGKKLVSVTVPIRNKQGEVTGEQRINTHRNTWNIKMAEAFAREAPAEAVKQHPELAGAAAAVMAIDKKAKADGLTPAQREIVAARARQNAVNSIMCGNMPEVTLRKDVQVQQQATTEEEYSR